MSRQIVALSVDKIQTFLTEVIHSHVQEKQTEDATLRKILNASDQISAGFFQEVEMYFPEASKGENVLLKCSGVYIFYSLRSKEKLEQEANRLFEQYYIDSEGQKLLRYAILPDKNQDPIKDIQEAKKQLKKAGNWNRAVEQNRELLFSFCEVPQNIPEGKRPKIDGNQFPYFAEELNALAKTGEGDGGQFRIAVLKADLDGMGEMFKRIGQYEEYQAVSEVLNQQMCLEGLHKAAESCAPSKGARWLFPLYVAGDDLFFAVVLEHLIYGVDVCRNLTQEINKEIKEKIGRSFVPLSVSVGVEITFNKQPIRYYLEMVEAQLKKAKKTKCPQVLRKFLQMKIGICDLVFLDVDYKSVKERIDKGTKKKGKWVSSGDKKIADELKQAQQNFPIWSFFIHDLKLLSYIRNEESKCANQLGRPHFFYTLLEDITDKTVQSDNIRYINHVLYRLFPSYGESSDQKLKNLEIRLNGRLLTHLCERVKGETRLVVKEETKHRFQAYVRLMLLFSDPRFQIFGQQKKEKENFGTQDKKAEGILLKKSRKYLYEICLNRKGMETPLRDVFVVQSILSKDHRKPFCCLALEPSMLYRLRTMPAEQAAERIELRNPSTEEEKERIAAANNKRLEEGKHPNRLFFDKEQFLSLAEESGEWTPDFVDSLMLFYRYHELIMEIEKHK